MTVESGRVRQKLRKITDPCSAANGSNLNIVEMGLVKDIGVEGKEVRVEMRLTTPACHMVPYFLDEIEEKVGAFPEVKSVNVETDDGMEWKPEMMSERAKEKRQAVIDEKV
jgi:metal-sulfur cluster biosynthetic enzyme